MRDARRYFDANESRFMHAPWLGALRESGFALVEKQGLPQRNREAWHYTDLERALSLYETRETRPAKPLGFDAVSSSQFIFHEGALISTPPAQNGVRVVGSDEELQALCVQDSEDIMRALNNALLNDALILEIEGTPEKPVLVRFTGDLPAHIRLMVRVKKQAQAQLVLAHEQSGYLNLATDIELADDAQLNVLTLQNSGACVSDMRAQVGAGALCNAHYFISGDVFARHAPQFTLGGAGAHVGLYGGFLGCAEAYSDLTAHINHVHADSRSDTQIRNLVSERAKGVFQGKIIVARDAQRIDARQKSDTLMLCEDAQMNVKPELEIYADDVSCTHGATMGAMDEDALFYLRARGIELAQAQRLLLFAFLEPLLEKIEDDALAAFMRAVCDHEIAELAHV